MDEKFTDLEFLRIHELRDLARKMGVNAPTSKKKETLIDEIMKIMSGESLPSYEKSKKGRPVRNSSDNFDVVDLILPTQEELKSFNESLSYDADQERLHFMVNMDGATYDDDNSIEENNREGYVELKSEGYGVIHVDGFCSSNRDVFINRILVKQLKLKNGEKVIAKCKRIKENYPEIAFEITKITAPSDIDYDSLNPKPLGDYINICTTDLKRFKLGGRYFVNPIDDAYIETANIATEIKKKCSNVIVETLYLNAMLERIPYGEDITINSIPFSKVDEDVVIGTMLYFEKMKRLVESTGKDVVIVISELSQFAKSYNNISLKNSSYSEISNHTAYKLKNLLCVAKSTDNGSITIIVVDKLRVPQNIQNLFEYEIMPLFNI